MSRQDSAHALKGVGDWHLRTLRLYDSHQHNKRLVSRSAASREHRVSPNPHLQEQTHQDQLDDQSFCPRQSYQTPDSAVNVAVGASSQSHIWSNHSNRGRDVEIKPALFSFQRNQVLSALSQETSITEDLYFQGK